MEGEGKFTEVFFAFICFRMVGSVQKLCTPKSEGANKKKIRQNFRWTHYENFLKIMDFLKLYVFFPKLSVYFLIFTKLIQNSYFCETSTKNNHKH